MASTMSIDKSGALYYDAMINLLNITTAIDGIVFLLPISCRY